MPKKDQIMIIKEHCAAFLTLTGCLSVGGGGAVWAKAAPMLQSRQSAWWINGAGDAKSHSLQHWEGSWGRGWGLMQARTHTRTHAGSLTLGSEGRPTEWSACCGWQSKLCHCPDASLWTEQKSQIRDLGVNWCFLHFFFCKVGNLHNYQFQLLPLQAMQREERKKKITPEWREKYVCVTFHCRLF